MPRFINQIFTVETGEFFSNAQLLAPFQEAVERLDLGFEAKEELHQAVKYFLMGERSRRVVPNWLLIADFREKMTAFEKGVEDAIELLVSEISDSLINSNVTFDAVITASSTGSVMPSISYRLARHLPHLIRTDSLMVDFGNVGCTAGLKALNLAKSLDATFKNILVVCIELPSTLLNLDSTKVDVWQGNCTFGDGAAALWISSNPEQGNMALELEHIHYVQKAQQGLDLIYWGYESYYTFKLGDQNTFNRDVQAYILEALEQTQSTWQDNQCWAIHPAGITVLLKLSRKLKLSRDSITPSVMSYEKYSNMSSASIMFILKDLAQTVEVGQAINLLTMGAGFNVINGRVRKVR